MIIVDRWSFFPLPGIQLRMAARELDIFVVGAGMAGLTAARTLAEAGHTVTVLEAASRIGGRILTLREGTEVIELGAEFIHGRPPELWSLIEEANLETYEIDGPQLTYDSASGKLEAVEWDESSEPASSSDAEVSRFAVLDQLETYTGPDIPFAEYLTQHPLPDEASQSAIGYVEGFNAADHRIIGVAALGLQQSAEDAIEGDRIFRVRAGYDRVPEFLAGKIISAGGKILLDHLVERIEWTPGRVRVESSFNGQPIVHEAARAVITLPLGVLQQHAVEFVPIPDPLHEARRLRMGQARRFTLLFREKFWTHSKPHSSRALTGDFSFLFAFDSMPPVWWTSHPEPSNTLTGWIGGPRSEALANLTPRQLGELACEALATIFSLPLGTLRTDLVNTYTHDWQRDALASGSYSYVPAGALDACTKMTHPAANTLFFAGEHTDTTGHWGTVHAAIRTGRRAAQQILDAKD